MSGLSKKQNIINIAAELFTEKGYKATSMRDLASRVGLEASSIYSHIKSKEDILTEICMSCAHLFKMGMDKIIVEQNDEMNKLIQLIDLHISIASENASTSAVFTEEWRHLPEGVLQEFLAIRKEYEKQFKHLLQTGKSKGVFYFTNVDICFNIILQMLQYCYLGLIKNEKKDVEKDLKQMIINSVSTSILPSKILN